MSRSFTIVSLSVALLTGCASSEPRLHQPDRIDAYCGDKAALATAVESIVSSTSDMTENAPIPSSARIIAGVKASGGVVAHWNSQPLHLPAVARSIGESGAYVTLGDAAIGDGSVGADSRRIYLTLKTPTGAKTFALRAFDVQDVCNEGKLKS